MSIQGKLGSDYMKSKYTYRLVKEGYEHYGPDSCSSTLSIVKGNTKDELIAGLLNFIWMTSGYYEEDE